MGEALGRRKVVSMVSPIGPQYPNTSRRRYLALLLPLQSINQYVQAGSNGLYYLLTGFVTQRAELLASRPFRRWRPRAIRKAFQGAVSIHSCFVKYTPIEESNDLPPGFLPDQLA